MDRTALTLLIAVIIYASMPEGASSATKYIGPYKLDSLSAAQPIGNLNCNDGGWVVEIKDAEMNKAVQDLIRSNPTDHWIGARYESGTWKWNRQTPVVYTNWEDSQPSDPSTFLCATISPSTGKWKPVKCSPTVAPYVCQTVPSTINNLPSGPYMVKQTDAMTSRGSAADACAGKNSWLVIIDNEEINGDVYDLIRRKGTMAFFWIGLKHNGSSWNWNETQTSTYSKWPAGTLVDYPTHTCAAVKGTDATWHQKKCEEGLGYICQSDICPSSRCGVNEYCKITDVSPYYTCINPCEDIGPCDTDGRCRFKSSSPHYECSYPCRSGPCRNGGTCSVTGYDIYSCACTTVYTGKTCAALYSVVSDTCNYTYHDNETHENANSSCIARHGALAMDKSTEIHEKILNLFNLVYNSEDAISAWAGGGKINANWKWSDTTAILLDSDGQWEASKPGDAGNCMSFKPTDSDAGDWARLTWTDVECDKTLNYICEVPRKYAYK